MFESYPLWLTVLGLAVLFTTILPSLLRKYPFSMSVVLLALGYAAIKLPLGLNAPDPLEQGVLTEHLTEFGVIVSIMGAGLKIDRPPGLKGWESTWRLLGIAMVVSMVLAAFIGWWVAAFVPASAILIGAVLAPTDPVLASEVQIVSPGDTDDPDETGDEPEEADTDDNGELQIDQEEKDEVRFALTSEAGLNDGLAFPFVNMALVISVVGFAPENWFFNWLAIDVIYKLTIGGVTGYLLGKLIARILLSQPAQTPLAKTVTGMGSLAATLLLFGFTEMLNGYGFLATFIGALTIRNYERKHAHHKNLHRFAEIVERIMMMLILVALGGAIAGGLFDYLSWPLVISALLIVFVVRPFAGMVSMIGFKKALWRKRAAISFFGIRGIGTLYYLSYALNQIEFPQKEQVWALVGFVVVISIFVHGTLATPLTRHLDKLRAG